MSHKEHEVTFCDDITKNPKQWLYDSIYSWVDANKWDISIQKQSKPLWINFIVLNKI